MIISHDCINGKNDIPDSINDQAFPEYDEIKEY
jgi:hypothetical protein